MKRPLLAVVAAATVFLVAGPPAVADRDQDNNHGQHGRARFELLETTIPEIQHALRSRVISAERLTRMYLKRIDAYEETGPAINAYQLVNENAVRQARQLDALIDRRGHSRMPLFGVPVLLKDNIDTRDMPTAAGSVALNGSLPPDDAFITKKLRAAGAVILGKGTLTEFANFIAVGMPTGYSSLGGFGFNPYDPRVDPRTEAPFNDGRPVLQTGGSSSGPGIGVNANLVAVAIGTETSGSILSPASANGVVGIKPTVGLVSRDGIIPITADQDTAGPLTRTVTDAAIVLGVIAGYDPNDPATNACLTPGNCFEDYTRFLNKKALRGARLAVPPFPENRRAIMEAAIAVMRAQGATCRTDRKLRRTHRHAATRHLHREARADRPDLFHGAAVRLQARSQRVSRRDPGGAVAYARRSHRVQRHVRSTDEIRTGHRDRCGSARRVSRKRRYRRATWRIARKICAARSWRSTASSTGPTAMPGTDDDFDAVIHLGNANANVPAKAGYPSVAVPGGFNALSTLTPADPPIAVPFPSDVTFSGPAFSEPRLIALAYAFEQATRHRVPPASTPALPSDTVRSKH